MKIGFDVSDLTADKAEGTTRYTWELAKRLPALGAEHDWLFFAPSLSDATKSQLAHERVQFLLSPWPKYWTQSRLPYDLYKARPDVLFMPIQQLPFVRPRGIKTVAVVHDLAWHWFGQQTTYKDWMLQHIFTSYVAREADQIICVSQATADDVVKVYGRNQNLHVIHHGVDHERFRPPAGREQPSAQMKLTKKYGELAKPYLLYVGQIQPRKNLNRLIEAFEILAERDEDLQLALAGSHGWLRSSIEKRVKTSGLASRIHMLGRVPEELLVPLYWNAEVYVLPSLYEGFGMPILEAMACGVPVVTSNVSAMPEVAGDSAVLIDPYKARDIARGIDQARRERLKLKTLGLDRSASFTWAKCAQKTINVLL